MKKSAFRAACPCCFRAINGAIDHFSERTPRSGDYALCSQCGEFSIFDFARRSNTLRRPNANERWEIARNDSAAMLRQRRVREVRH